jgi:hypothetical protein
MIFEHVEGGLRLTIDEHSRSVVVHLLGELRTELDAAKVVTPDHIGDHMKRLFPSAYHDDAKLNDEYRRLTHGDLADSHIAAIDDAVKLLAPDHVIRNDELERFVRALNAMRLVLGTVLDVSEDDDVEGDESADSDVVVPQREVYDYLGWLLHASLDQLRT